MLVSGARWLRLRTAWLVAIDLGAVWLAARWAATIRHLFDAPGELGVAAATARPMLEPSIVTALWLMAFASAGLYRPIHRLSVGTIFIGVLRGAGWGLALVVMTTFFVVREAFLPARSLPLIHAALAIPLVTMGRAGALALLGMTAPALLGRSRMAIVGTGRTANLAADLAASDDLLASEVIGLIRTSQDSRAGESGRKELGQIGEVAAIIEREKLDRLLIADDGLSSIQEHVLALVCQDRDVELNRVAAPGPAGRYEILLDVRGGLPLLRVSRPAPNRLGLAAKRAVDLLLSAVLLVLSLPIVLLIVVALAVEGGGPAIITQRRVGRGGRVFDMMKFRSMKEGERRHTRAWDGPLWKDPDDPRVTRVGRVLRRFSLDELPQLLNVQRGDMSLVGPRPLLADDLGVEGGSEEYAAWSEVRSRMRPGITGLWQVRGRKELSFEEMMRLDIFYCQNWRPLLDLAVLLRTVPAVLRGRGAY